MALEYNTARDGLKIPEYGRNVQKMVAFMLELPDKEQRTAAAHSIINIMVNLNPQLKEQSDYKIKLWDHLYMISGPELDIDAPFPMPDFDVKSIRPVKPAYSSNHIKYRYYGKNVERMIEYGGTMEDGPAKDVFLNSLASYMKMAYRVWNDEKVPDDVIINHLKLMSDGKLVISHINDLPAHNEATISNTAVRTKNKRKGGGLQKKNFRKN